MGEDFRRTLLACYNENCLNNVKSEIEPTCMLKLVGLNEEGKCTSFRERKIYGM
jgi:ABC-type Mn2+/Zn2+ transport system ATPase subunit